MSRASLHDSRSDRDTLELFPEWGEPVTSRRLLRAGIGSLAVHAIVIALLIAAPETSGRWNGPPITADFRQKAVPLVAPRVFDLTQKDENKGKIKHELDIRSSMRQAAPKAKAFVPPAPAGPVIPPAALTPPPQIEEAAAALPAVGTA